MRDLPATLENLKQSLVWSPGTMADEVVHECAQNVFNAFGEVDGDKSLVCLGSVRVIRSSTWSLHLHLDANLSSAKTKLKSQLIAVFHSSYVIVRTIPIHHLRVRVCS